MNFKKSILLLTLMIVATSFIFAAGEGEYEMRIGSCMSAYDNIGMASIKLAELVNAKSNGRIKTSVSTDGELGNERELTEMLRDGSLEVTTVLTTAPSSYVGELALFELPYIYKDYAHLVRVLKELMPYVEELLAPYNMKPTGYLSHGFRHMLNKKRPIYKVADMKGLKMRAPNPMYVGMLNALGANSITVTWNEVYTALQSGVVDGMEASPSLIYANKFQEQAKYLSKTSHIGGSVSFMLCKRWFDSLPEDLQKIVLEAIDEASDYGFKMLLELEEVAINKLVAEGLEVNEVEDLNEFREKCLSFRDNYVKEKGPSFEKLYNKILAVE